MAQGIFRSRSSVALLRIAQPDVDSDQSQVSDCPRDGISALYQLLNSERRFGLAFVFSSIGILCIELVARFFSGTRSLAGLLEGAAWPLACHIVMMPVGLVIRALVEGMSWFAVFVFSVHVPVILAALAACGLVMIATHGRAHPAVEPAPHQ